MATAPTKAEIKRARALVSDHAGFRSSLLHVMDGWEGQGWHESEILYGILIGLQIADMRNLPSEQGGAERVRPDSLAAEVEALTAQRDQWKEDYELCQNGLIARRQLQDESVKAVWDAAIYIAEAEAFERRMAYCVVDALKEAKAKVRDWKEQQHG